MEDKIWVDIIIPLYNCENTIERLLECLEQQTYKNVKIILIDDFSTDQTALVVNEYLKKTKLEITYEKMPVNGGGSNARNRGLALSKSKYMMLIDNDDELASAGVISYLVWHMEEQDSDLIIGEFRGIYKEGEIPLMKKVKDFLKAKKQEMSGSVEEHPEIIANCDTMVWSKMYRRSFIGNQIFNTELITSEDIYFINVLLLRCPKVQVVEFLIYDYWLGNTQSFSKQFHQSESFFWAFDLLLTNKNYHLFQEEINYVIIKNIALEYVQRILKFTTLDISEAKQYINDIVKKIGRDKLLQNKYLKEQSLIYRFVMKGLIKDRSTLWTMIRIIKK